MKKIIKILSLVLCIVVLGSLFTGCNKTDSKTVVTVNGEKVTVGRYRYIMQTLIMQVSNIYGTSIEELAKADYKIENLPVKDYIAKSALDQLVYLEVADQYFNELGYKFERADNDKLDEYIAMYEKQYGGAAGFDQALKNLGITRSMFKSDIKAVIKVEKIKSTYYGETGIDPVTSADARKVFDEKYARVKHILFTTVDDKGNALPAADVDAKKVQFEKILAEVQKPGADFDTYVGKYNEDPGSADYPNGYILGPNSQFVEEFRNESLALKVGAIGSTKSTYGYHIIKRYPLDDDKYFTDVETEILNELRQDKLDVKMKEKTDAATIIKNEVLIKDLNDALFTITFSTDTSGTNTTGSGS